MSRSVQIARAKPSRLLAYALAGAVALSFIVRGPSFAGPRHGTDFARKRAICALAPILRRRQVLDLVNGFDGVLGKSPAPAYEPQEEPLPLWKTQLPLRTATPAAVTRLAR